MSDVRPLRHLATVRVSNVDKKSVDGQVPVRLCNYTDVYHGDRITPNLDLMAATATPEQVRAFRLHAGDVIITKDSEDPLDIGVPAFVADAAPDLVCGYHLAVLRPAPDRTHGRYLYWAMASRSVQDYLSVSATGITRYGLRTDSISAAPIPWRPLPEQTAIADYLDAETARIDALINKKRRLIALLDERREGVIEEAVRALAREYGERPLRFAAPQVLVGIVITPAAYYADEGVLALRGVNIRPGRIDLTDTVNLSQEGHALHMKSRLAPGDVLVVRTGQAGAAAVVPPDLEGVNCIDLLIVRRSPVLHSAYLEFVLNSDWTRKHVEEHSVGTIQSHFNVGALKEVPVPVPPLDVQRKVAERLTTVVSRIDRAASRLSEQIDLLSERRQALVTTLVTGESEVPGMAA